MKEIKDKPYLPKDDFNRLCKLIMEEDLTFEKFIQLFPEDKESQKTLVNYIHSYDSGWTANPTLLEFLISDCHVSTSSAELDKITFFLLELGSPITALLLKNGPKNKLCRDWTSEHQVSANWSCTGTYKGLDDLLLNLMDMKLPVDTLEKVVELKSKSETMERIYITNKAFEYSNKDEKYATGLINLLMRHQLIALSPEALQQDSVTGIKLIKALGSQCLQDPNYDRNPIYAHRSNIRLLNYILKTFEEPFDLIKALLDGPEKVLQNFHVENSNSYPDTLNPLETVLSKYVDKSLELSKTKDLLILLLQKGAFPSPHVLLALNKIPDLDTQNELLGSIILHHVPDLKKNTNYQLTISRLINSLQLAYTTTENPLLRNKLSELLSMMPQPFQEENLLSLGDLDIKPRLNWLDQSSYYFTEVESNLRKHFESMPLELLSIILDYTKPLSLIETIIENLEAKPIGRLIVQDQGVRTSTCGPHTFTNGFLLLSLNERLRNKYLKLAISILKNTPYPSEEKQPATPIFKMASLIAANIASKIKQTDKDVSPITMRKMIHHPKFKKFFDEIYAIHQLYPGIVPVIKKNGTYQISSDFDTIEQLNMFYKLVALSDLSQHEKLINFIFYIFTENYWITLLMIKFETKVIFLVCDSLSNRSMDFLNSVTLPVQQIFTNKEHLRDRGTKLLTKSYQEINGLIKSKIWVTDFSLRHFKQQLHVWLALIKHGYLKKILGDPDAIKFAVIVRLITVCEKLTPKFTVKKHKELISNLKEFDLFSGKNEHKGLTAELKKFDLLSRQEPNNDNADLVTLIRVGNILKVGEFKADEADIDKIYHHFIKNRSIYFIMMTKLVNDIKKSVDINDQSLLRIALTLRLVSFEVTEQPKADENHGLQKKLLFSVQSLFNRLESAFFIRNKYIQLIKVAKLLEISIPFDPIKSLEDQKSDINTHLDKHIADYITIKDQIIAKINLAGSEISIGFDDVLCKVAIELDYFNEKEITLFKTSGAIIETGRTQVMLLRKIESFIPCEIRQILNLKKVIRLAFLSELITGEDAAAWIYSLDKDSVTATSCQQLVAEISGKISYKPIVSSVSSSSTSSSSSSSCSSSSSPSVNTEGPPTITLLMQSLTKIFKSKKEQETTEFHNPKFEEGCSYLSL